MAPSSSLRSRIAAFEAGTISNVDEDDVALSTNGPSESDAKSGFMDVPISPTESSLLGPSLKPTSSPSITPPASRPDSPDGPGGKTSLVDLSEFDSVRTTTSTPPQLPARPGSSTSASKMTNASSSRDSSSSYDVSSRFSFEFPSTRSTDSHTSVSSFASPPLPPRKPTHLQTTTSSTAATSSSPIAINASRPNATTNTSNDTNDGISSSWYKVPQLSSNQFLDVQSALSGSPRRGHNHANSTSSFHSVSLSSDGDFGEHTEEQKDDGPSATPIRSVAETIAAFSKQGNGSPTPPPPLPGHKLSSTPTPTAGVDTANLPYVPRKSPRMRDSSNGPGSPMLMSPQQTGASTTSSFSIGSTMTSGTGTKSPPPPPLPARKPTLPARPSAPSSTTSSSQSINTYSIRRVAPPPPPSAYPPTPQSQSALPPSLAASRSASTSSSVSQSAERRKAPIPPAVRKRYETLFDKNVAGRSSSLIPKRGSSSSLASGLRTPLSASQNGGWRGVDSDGSEAVSGAKTDAKRMDGRLVKDIWECSRLLKATLRRIWIECDPAKTGSVDREAFVRGMWSIDGELTKAQKAGARRKR